MRYLLRLAVGVALSLAVCAPPPANALPRQYTGTKYSLTCAADGSTTTTVQAGTYLLQVEDDTERACICLGSATCAEASAICLPAGAGIEIKIAASQTTISCLSAGASGVVELNRWVP